VLARYRARIGRVSSSVVEPTYIERTAATRDCARKRACSEKNCPCEEGASSRQSQRSDDPTDTANCACIHRWNWTPMLHLSVTSKQAQLLVCRLLPAKIFNLFFKRGFSEKCYSFPVGLSFMRKDLHFRLRSFEFRRFGKVDKKNRRSLKICSGASCAGHPTRRPSSETP
jgi:hypothetical protein